MAQNRPRAIRSEGPCGAERPAIMPQLTVENFRCFIGHPRLEELWAYTGKSTVNEQVKRMFPLIAR